MFWLELSQTACFFVNLSSSSKKWCLLCFGHVLPSIPCKHVQFILLSLALSDLITQPKLADCV